ncbi:MAG TPA: 4-(cytidine 5'-diphospho)-2-C-methyl-D-erythritol kinase [Acidobacteriota bacterium]|nr:4-(cytidine 5'-diphospho)-2-C-methyl-D-erythritol kinase [Acidobacteriota bacterium]
MKRTSLKVRSFAKINPALAVLGRRGDGYHNIQTLFQSIDLSDEMELHPAAGIEFSCEDLPGVRTEDNLAYKAAKALAAIVPGDRGVRISLKKNVPAGAGLGGGSSNAAAVLLGLCRFWSESLPDSELFAIAASLGSDVPFFLSGGLALGSGRGEILSPLPDLQTQHLVAVFPGIHVPTAEAYCSLNLGLTSSTEDRRIQALCGQIRSERRYPTRLFNDFEASILAAHRPVMEAKSFLERLGARTPLLSGSGSCVFGFFPDEESATAAARKPADPAWRVFPAKTLSRSEYFRNMFG